MGSFLDMFIKSDKVCAIGLELWGACSKLHPPTHTVSSWNMEGGKKRKKKSVSFLSKFGITQDALWWMSDVTWSDAERIEKLENIYRRVCTCVSNSIFNHIGKYPKADEGNPGDVAKVSALALCLILSSQKTQTLNMALLRQSLGKHRPFYSKLKTDVWWPTEWRWNTSVFGYRLTLCILEHSCPPA